MRTATVVRALALPLFAALAGPALAADPDLSKVEVKVETVAPGVAMLTGAGGNLALVHGEGGAFLVDDQYAPMHPKIVAAIATVTKAPLRFVLNTHWHGDHTGGNEAFGKAGALVVAHENVRERMSSDQFIAFWNETVPASPAAALPVVTFSDAVTFHLDGEAIRCRHVPPAHTDGDAIVTFARADVVHMGDVFFNGIYPFIDVASGGSVDGTIAAVDLVLGEVGEATKIIPGHGPLGDRAALRAYREMLAGVRDAVRPLVQAGKTKDEVVAAKPTAPWDAAWGKGFIKPDAFAGLLYEVVKADLERPTR